jgi:hypothetical protein
MKIIKSNIFYFLLLCIIATAIAIAALSNKSSQLIYTDFTITSPDGNTSPVQFPLYMQSPANGTYQLNGTIIKEKFTGTKVQIIPDDEVVSLFINNKHVDISHIPESSRRDYRNGFALDLNDYLENGDNSIVIVFVDTGGMMGVNFKSLYGESLGAAILILSGIFISLLIAKLKIGTQYKILLVAALFIRLFYFSFTPPDTRTHDQEEHLEYSAYLATHWLPPPLEKAVDGAYFHPPLYYYTGAITFKLTRLFGSVSTQTEQRIQQLLCLMYSMGFVFFGLLIIQQLLHLPQKKYSQHLALSSDDKQFPEKRSPENGKQLNAKLINLIKNPKRVDDNPSIARELIANKSNNWINERYLFLLIGAMFVLWPSSVIHSVRIGNDPLLYCLFAASLYYIIRWSNSDKKRDLLIASALTAAATLTKANGEVLIVVIGILGLYKMITSREWVHYIKLAILPCIIVFLSLAITIGPGLLLKLEGKRDQLYIDNINNVSSALRVGNTAVNFLWFDAKTFITEPFTSPWEDEKGRQYFINYLGKTGLFGEFGYGSLLSKNTAVVSSLIAVLMSIYMIFGMYHMTREDFKRQTVILLSGFFLLAGVTYMRMTFPVNIDFRYILPILITFCVIYANSITTFHRLGATRLAGTGMIMAVLFSLSNIIFIFGI